MFECFEFSIDQISKGVNDVRAEIWVKSLGEILCCSRVSILSPVGVVADFAVLVHGHVVPFWSCKIRREYGEG